MASRSAAWVSGFLLSFLVCVVTNPGTAPAQTGQVTGEVTDARTGQALNGAQVFVAGTQLGTITDEQGAYEISGVPAGEQTIRVQLIGYSSASRTIDVTAGQTVNVDFRLNQSAIALEEVVVTGTGAATERRKLGNTIASVDASEIAEQGGTTSFSEMISAREPGVQVLPTSGLAGEGARIRIRGSSSLTQSNEPLIYVNGVRVSNAGGFGAGVGAGGGGTPSRLDDINPASIERIEILKGPAAATLYGSEATSGVIQIFTKTGEAREPRWNVSVEQGISQFTNRYHDAQTRCGYSIADEPTVQPDGVRDRGIPNIEQYWDLEQSLEPYEVFCVDMFDRLGILETGRNQQYSLSVNGGGETARYFLAGRYANINGPIGAERWGPAQDFDESYNFSSSLTLFALEDLRVRITSNYTHRFHETMENNNNIFGVLTKTTDSNPVSAWSGNPTGSNTFVTVPEAMQRQTFQETDHYTGSANLNFSPTGILTLDATFGADFVGSQSTTDVPFGWNVDNFTTFNVDGLRNHNKTARLEISSDVKGTVSTDLTDNLTSDLVLGGQLFVSEQKEALVSGEQFPGPGLEVTNAAALQSTFESRLEEVSGGVFAQEQVGYRDWIFLTLGARLDKHSAFGEAAGAEFYPKASFSVVPSDWDNWNSDLVSTLRVRGAFGKSGLQPGAFDQFTTFQALPSVDGPGVAPDNLGNPELRPEISTEWEVGGELGLWNDRVSVETTYWDRSTTDALVERQFAPTGGFRNTQLDNIGELTASGLEVNVNGAAYQSEDVRVDVFANAAYLEQEIVDLSPAPPLKVGGSYPRYRNWLREGYAPGTFFGPVPMDVEYPISPDGTCEPGTREELLSYFSTPRTPDEITILEEDCGTPERLEHELGKPTPDWSGSFGTDVTFSRFQLHTLFEFKAGNYQVHNLTLGFHQHNPLLGRNERESAEIESTLLNPESTPQERLDAGVRWVEDVAHLSPYPGMNAIHDADYLRWREVSLRYEAPSSWVSVIGGQDLAFTVAGRNVALWTVWSGADPEANQQGRGEGGGLSNNFLTGVNAWSVPLPWRATISAEISF